MKAPVLFLSLLAVPLYVYCSVQLVESGPRTVNPGGTLRLTCTVTGDSVQKKYWEWVRQAPGKGLEWMGQIDWSSRWRLHYNPSLQSRITLTADSSSNTYDIELRSVTAADTAMYYCARVWGVYFDYWGSGTMVTVTQASITAPTVFPLPPCSQGSSTASQVSIGCLITGYFPEPVTVQWNSGAITRGVRTFPALLHSSSGLYTLSSQLTIPTSSWESEKFQCNVAHAASRSTISKDIERQSAISPVAPEVRLLHSSCDSRSSDATIELLCIISRFYPKTVTVEWLGGGQAGLLGSFTEEPQKDVHGYTFSTTSTVNVSQADWQAGNVYYCQVFHEATQTKVKSKAKICEDAAACPSTGIDVRITLPTPKDLYVNSDPKLICVVENLVDTDGLKISWSRKMSGPVSQELLETKEEPNGKYTATKALSAPTWLQGDEFTCKVEYPGLAAPIIRTITKTTGTTHAPEVYLFRPHPEEIRARPPMLTLTCMVSGFFPEEVSIQWLKNHNAIPEDHHVNTPVMKNNNNHSYFMYSQMKIPLTDWNNGNTFTCMVIHEALPMKFTQRTVEKSQGKK